MPTCDFNIIPKMLSWLVDIQPKTVLDLGCGFGKWGMLVKEYVGLDTDEKVKKWTETGKIGVRVEGVEIFGGYIKGLQESIYDEVYVMDVFEFVSKSKRRYDCIVMVDSLEHLSKAKGRVLLSRCIARSDTMLISVPMGCMFREEFDKLNPREEHLSGWVLDDFRMYNVVDFEYVTQSRNQRKQLLVRIDGSSDRNNKLLDKTLRYVDE